MKKKTGLILLNIITVLHIINCGMNIAYQNNTEMDNWWFVFPTSGHGICYPLFIFTAIVTAASIYNTFLHKKVSR